MADFSGGDLLPMSCCFRQNFPVEAEGAMAFHGAVRLLLLYAVLRHGAWTRIWKTTDSSGAVLVYPCGVRNRAVDLLVLYYRKYSDLFAGWILC